jgi:hypothetical protein
LGLEAVVDAMDVAERESLASLRFTDLQQALIQQQQMMEVMRVQMQSLMLTGGTGPPFTFPWVSSRYICHFVVFASIVK